MGQATRALAGRLAQIPTPGVAGVWTAGGDMGTARFNLAGAGTQAAGLAMGGNGPSASTEEYTK